MIRRPGRPARRLPGLEALEPRALMSVGSAPGVSVAIGPVPPVAPAASQTQVFVKFAATATPRQQAAAVAAVGGTTITEYPGSLDLVQLRVGADVAAAIRTLEARPSVAYAATNDTIHVAAAVTPNDPGYPYNWGLNNPNDVDIDAPAAWGVTTGSPGVIVAVLDSGLDLANPDFAGHLWTNPGNDAAAGEPNDIHGWNFASNTNNVGDDNGHGTHVTSLIAAAGNNASGIAGVAWNVQIMPVKFLDSNGDGTTAQAVSAIYYAVNHGARVINASWGGIDYTQPLAEAIAYANARNVVFVTAAGNEGTNNDLIPSYPASLRLPNELSVAAIDANGQIPSFSNYGGRTVDLAAPGVSILGDYPSYLSAGGYQVLSGTSMATAYVTGVAALVASQHPEYTAAQIVRRIGATVKPLPGLAGRVITGGMVDAARALSSTDADVEAAILGSDEYFAAQGGTPRGFVGALYVDLLDRAADPGGLNYWAGLLQSGASTRGAVVSAILNSPEARTTRVAEWYRDDLGRTAPIAALKADAGVQFWAGLLNQGIGAAVVESFLLASPEYLQSHGSSPAAVTASWYQGIMGRDADPSGQATWSNLLGAGLSPLAVVQGFQATPEARATRVARWYVRYLDRTTPLAALKADPGVLQFAATLTT